MSTITSSDLPTGRVSATDHQITIVPTIRRKPKITYRSPPAFSGPIILPKSASPSVPKPTPSPSDLIPDVQMIPKRRPPAFTPSLPLYHPLGRLAMSLPPLDPTTFGLPAPIISVDDGRRSSARSRKPAARKDRAVDTEEATSPTPSTTAAKEAKAATPRKKRSGGGGGSKRKRKEVDDGDATYPAKRPRHPRGSANVSGADEAESMLTNGVLIDVTAPPEPALMDVVPDEGIPERRSTRSRASKRRDSSASESNSSSAKVKSKSKEPVAVEKPPEVDQEEEKRRTRSQSKEEGELSEEGKP